LKRHPLHIAVIGAGAFGGWTALHLLERGARVTLLDAWGPGNSRSSSGGETRIMRATYGPNQPYTELAARALKLWQKYEKRWKRQFLHRTGVLWMATGRNDAFERGSVKMLCASKIEYRELSAAEMRKLWPQINFQSIEWGIFEPECGYLDARASCQAVVEAFIAAGGEYRQLAMLPGKVMVKPNSVIPSEVELPAFGQFREVEEPAFIFPVVDQVRSSDTRHVSDALEDSLSRGLNLSDNSKLKADFYVFACGPWLGKLFHQTIGNRIRPTKQDIFFFGPPAGDARFTDAHLPVWADHRDRFYYGIPSALSGNAYRGFKIADDTRGPDFDPTNGERIVSQETLKGVREYLALRFPALKDAPLLETRVCQYEQTPDSHFIIDRHPKNEKVWLVGGGSGHGFKHGPALGELISELILTEKDSPPIWRLARFQK
jgi:glycine/D-amino acid oxidase-like deaminating enzyme